jgi:hypothetical protein
MELEAPAQKAVTTAPAIDVAKTLTRAFPKQKIEMAHRGKRKRSWQLL